MNDLLSDLDNQDYDASSIEILEGLEPVRKALGCTSVAQTNARFTIWFLKF